MDDRLPPWFLADLDGSLERLVAAGLLRSHAEDPGLDLGVVEFSHEALTLLEAGCPPLSFPEFVALWDRSDYPGMRSWLKRKAAEFGLAGDRTSARRRRRRGA